MTSHTLELIFSRIPPGENVEEAFLETARRIYQSIQDGSLELNAAESGVQHKPSPIKVGGDGGDAGGADRNCSC